MHIRGGFKVLVKMTAKYEVEGKGRPHRPRGRGAQDPVPVRHPALLRRRRQSSTPTTCSSRTPSGTPRLSCRSSFTASPASFSATLTASMTSSRRAAQARRRGDQLGWVLGPHCRRYFFEAAICKYPIGVQGLMRIRAIYAADDAFGRVLPAKRKLLRAEHVRPLMESFFEWVAQARATVQGRDLATKALGYAFNQKQQLLRVLEDGRLPLDNIRSERSLRNRRGSQELDVLRQRHARRERRRPSRSSPRAGSTPSTRSSTSTRGYECCPTGPGSGTWS